MNLLFWIIVGGIAGWLASKVMKTDAQMGIISNIVVGAIGAFVGGTLLVLLQGGGFQITAFMGFDILSLIVAMIGAIIFLGIVKMINKPKTPATPTTPTV